MSTTTQPSANKWTINRDKVKEQVQRGPSFWKPTGEASHRIRIYPIPGEGTFFVKVYQHFIEGPAGRTGVYCPLMMEQGDACPICAQWQQLRRSDDDKDQRDAKNLGPRVSFFSPIVVYNELEKGVQIYSYGTKVMKQLSDVLYNPSEYGEVFDPETGRDWFITRNSLGAAAWQVEYKAAPGGRNCPGPTHKNIDLEAIPELVRAPIKFSSPAELTALMRGALYAAEPTNPVLSVEELVAQFPEMAAPEAPALSALEADEEDDPVAGPVNGALQHAGTADCSIDACPVRGGTNQGKFCNECGIAVVPAPVNAASGDRGNSLKETIAARIAKSAATKA